MIPILLPMILDEISEEELEEEYETNLEMCPACNDNGVAVSAGCQTCLLCGWSMCHL